MATPTVNGISANTAKRMLLDAGAVYKNLQVPALTGDRLGATSGGNTFTIEQEDVVPEIDGAPGALKGVRRRGTASATMTCNFIEMSKEILLAKLGMAATDYTTSGDYHVIQRSLTLNPTAYFENIALVVTHSSNTTVPFIVMIKNVLGQEGLELTFEDKNNAVLEATFSAHYDPADMGNEPWAIYLPGSSYVS